MKAVSASTNAASQDRVSGVAGGALPASDFCNFLRRPDPRKGEVFGIQEPEAFKRALRKLAVAISTRSHSFWDGAPLPNAEFAHQNPKVPAGYAFLLQLIAHDLVDTRRNAHLVGNLFFHQNARAGRLQLETVYGDTPEQSQHVYEADAAHRASWGAVRRTHFRLEPPRPPAQRPANTRMCPFRDIARLTPGPYAPDADPLNSDLPSEPCIADLRNDSSAMLSQLVVLFHQLHNTLFDCLAEKASKPEATSEGAWAETLFNCTRDIVVTLYRRIILQDVLPRILHPQIAEAYAGRQDLLPCDPMRVIPMEFSLGASRFAHAMISNDYDFNGVGPIDMEQGLWRGSRRRPDLLPLEMNWLADWARFFAVDGGPLNLSRRIGPSYPGPFSSFSLFPSAVPESAGLIYRDMIAGLDTGMWSVAPLIEALHDRYAEQKLHGLAALMKPYPSLWRDRIRDWLLTQPELDLGHKITPAEADLIANDPPLAFFVQFEAAVDPVGAGISRKTGQHLGPLGSAIIAETVYAMLLAQPVATDFRRPDLDGQFRDICGAYLGRPDALDGVFPASPETMPAVLTFLKARGCFG